MLPFFNENFLVFSNLAAILSAYVSFNNYSIYSRSLIMRLLSELFSKINNLSNFDELCKLASLFTILLIILS